MREFSSQTNLDVPLRQRHLSHALDEAVHLELLDTAPDTRSKAMSSAIHRAGDWLNVIPSSSLGLHLQDLEFRLCLQYWLGLRMVEDGIRVSSVSKKPLVTIRWAVGGMGIGYTATTLFGMLFTLQLNLQP